MRGSVLSTVVLAVFLLTSTLSAGASPAIPRGKPLCVAGSMWSIDCHSESTSVDPSAEGGRPDSGSTPGESFSCGPRRPAGSDPLPSANTGCATYNAACPLPPGAPADTATQVVVFQAFDAATKALIHLNIACDAATPIAAATATQIRAEATRRAPQPTTASGGTNYLLNSAIVFYATPPNGLPQLSDITIAPFTLAGHTFHIRLHLTHTTWTWGDGTTTDYPSTGTLNPLGRPYQPTDPCSAPTSCPQYVAHTFTHPGTATITVEAHWNATYTLDTTPQQIPIPGDIHRTDPTGRTITIHPAHSTLTPTN